MITRLSIFPKFPYSYSQAQLIKMKAKEPYQKIVACGRIENNEVYQVEMSPDFHPYRKDVQYRSAVREVPLSELNQYNEWKEVRSRLRYGHFEISEALFYHIYHLMTEKP